jgi:hypothetical protein
MPAFLLERRAAQRYRCSEPLPCRISAGALGPLGPAVVHSISAGGLGLVLSSAVDEGATLTVKIEAPIAAGVGPLEVRVIHGRPYDPSAERQGDGHWIAGCILIRKPGPEFDALLAAVQNGTATEGVERKLEAAVRTKTRSSVRMSCTLVGLCHWDEGGHKGSCPVRVRNISHGGLSLLFSQEVGPVQFITVDLVNAARAVSCTVKARVLYKVEQPGGGYIVGASFPDKLDPVKLRALLS